MPRYVSYEIAKDELADVGINLNVSTEPDAGEYVLTFDGEHGYDATYADSLDEALHIGHRMAAVGHKKWYKDVLDRIFMVN